MTDAYRALGVSRARRHRQAVTTTIHNLRSLLDERGFEADQYLEKARAIRSNLPERYRAEFRGVLSELPVSETELLLYTFSIPDVTSDLTGESDAGEECTNAVVDGSRTPDGHPLVLKNRDISARGLRPQSVLEVPATESFHGFLTVSTACSVFVFQGVNDAGLVAANTFVDRAREDVSPGDRLRNGVLVRRILEECDSVADAKAFVADQRLDRSKGLTLSLADASRAALLEIDPQSASVRELTDAVIPRTNHFPDHGDSDDDSSLYRLERARELCDALTTDVTVEDLTGLATDHWNGPGPNSICRHPVNEHNDPYTLSQSTTVSTTVFRGGDPGMYAGVGNPCQTSLKRYEFGNGE